MPNRISWAPALLLVMAWGAEAQPRGVCSIRGEVRAPASRTRPGSAPWTSAVVWLESVPRVVEHRLALEAKQSRVRQAGIQFEPRIQVVTVGSRVMFENQDKVFHNVFTRSPENVFDTGQYAPGRSRYVMFDSVGVVQLYCAIHPEMSGTVVVVPNHAWTRAAADGSFEIAGLTPGTYGLRVWHPVHGSQRVDVVVPMPKNTLLRVRYGAAAQVVADPAQKRPSAKPSAKTSAKPSATAEAQPLRNKGGRFSR
jgi:plastocyanin